MTHLASDFDAPATVSSAVPFVAATRHGAMHLTLQRPSTPARRSAASLHAAAVLAEAEPLLQWLEDWLGEALDPAPCETCSQADVPAARLHWRWGELAAIVDVPWPALLACRPAPELAGFWRDAVRWEELALQLVIAHEPLADDEWHALQVPGAGWLLRESFGADGHWPCELRLQLGAAVHAWPAHWQPGRRRLAWNAAPSLCRPAPHECAQAVLARPLHLTPPALLGWHGEPACDCSADQPVAVLPAPIQGRCALAAHLVPIGLRLARAEANASVAGAGALHAGYVLQVEAD